MSLSSRSIWTMERAELTWSGAGPQEILDEPMTAFFASRRCPGSAIRAAMDWALDQAKSGAVVVSGFHSPLEQSVLTVLLQARCQVVAVLTRPVVNAKLPPLWNEPLQQKRMVVISTATSAARLTAEEATQRNKQTALLAAKIVVAHASPDGSLADLVAGWQESGRNLVMLSPLP